MKATAFSSYGPPDVLQFELLVTPADQIVAKPVTMPWEVAGGFTAGAQTSHLALTFLGVGPGDTVLIHAAAGTVGTVAVRLAQLWGASVIGTTSAANHEYLRALGAIPVVYGDGLVDRVRAVAPGGVDAALDAAGGDVLALSVGGEQGHDRYGQGGKGDQGHGR